MSGVPPSRRRAFVTFLMFNDSYLPGCLMAAYGLQRQRSRSDRVCMVTKDVTPRAREALRSLYTKVLEVEEIPVPGYQELGNTGGPRTGSARVKGAALTRFASLRLGPDGDFGCSYDKIVNIDADLLPMRGFEQLWRVPAPAGIINEDRDHMAEINDQGGLIPRPEALQTRKWIWHDVYDQVCPPGAPIPQEITDRVAHDYQNYGVNASLLVLEPSMKTYREFVDWVDTGDVRAMVQEKWAWTDQQAATYFWSGRWTSLDPRYSIFYGYPSVDLAYGLHYAGIKPWSWRKRGFARRIQRFADYALWSEIYQEMLSEVPHLRKLTGLRKLETELRAVRR